jgi:hypothetical protein
MNINLVFVIVFQLNYLINAFDRRVLFANYVKLEKMTTISGRGFAFANFTKSMTQSVGGRQISLPFTSLLSDSLERQQLLPHLQNTKTEII